jgi:tetratricopeptide (TPR) repeat protein
MALFAESLERLRPLQNPALLVDGLVFSSILLHLCGDYEASRAALAEGEEYAHAAGDKWFAIYAMYNRGYVASLTGRYEEGYKLMLRGLELWRKESDPRSTALGLNFITPTAVLLGYSAEAQAFAEESIWLCSKIGDRWGLGTAQRQLGLALLAQGRTEEARESILTSLETFQDFVIGWDVVQSQIHLAECAAVEGDAGEAERLFRLALAGSLDIEARAQTAEVLAGMARLRIDDGRCQEALILALSVLRDSAAPHSSKEKAKQVCLAASRKLPGAQQAEIAATARSYSLVEIAGMLLAGADGGLPV